jgi:tyrosinase
MSGLRKRRDIQELIDDKDRTDLDNLIRAFIGIQKLPPNEPYSFEKIAGYHGAPFRGAGWGNAQWWGGYCNHGNVLFPTWHRAYLLRLEEALQSVEGCGNVSLPYWNQLRPPTACEEGNESSLGKVIPDLFLQPKYRYTDGTEVDNPLFSYKFQKTINDNLIPTTNDDPTDYSKYLIRPKDTPTVRYPFSASWDEAHSAGTKQHNEEMTELGIDVTNQYLQNNVITWLETKRPINDQGKVIYAGLKDKYIQTLEAPNYTVFSNTTSAQQWNQSNADDNSDGFVAVVPLESPHNGMHLAIGGFEIPEKSYNTQIPDANGDMGVNETAAFDPIFYFHHCWIDLLFWQWQRLHKSTEYLEIMEEYPGTNSVDSQGPTPGVAGNTWLTMSSPLAPFKYRNNDDGYVTSNV